MSGERGRQFLSDEEILHLLEIPYDSEDELGVFIDEDNLTDVQLFSQVDEVVSVCGTLVETDAQSEKRQLVEEAEDDQPAEQDNSNQDLNVSTAHSISTKPNISSQRAKSKKKKRPQQEWKEGNLEVNPNEKQFKGNLDLPLEISELDSPYQFFKYFFGDDILKKISFESSLYSSQKDPAKAKHITPREIERFLGVVIFSSVINCTSVRDMWKPVIGNDIVKNTMCVNTFESLRAHIHLNDNSKMKSPDDPDRDRLFKLRPIIDHLNDRFLTVLMRPELSVDEQICATKTRHFMRQYNPRKPHKWGFKLYVLCDDKGFSYKFEIYSGQPQLRLNNEPDLGETGNIVVRLCREVPRNHNYTIYSDNFYSSLSLFAYLKQLGIFALGTFRRDRIPNSPFTEKKAANKEARGTTNEFITVQDEIPVSMVSWRDNDTVMIGSTLCGVLPMETIKRYDRKQKKFIDVQCPQIIKVYNRHMGGVDLMDAHIGRHHIQLKSRKWYFRLFYHMIDMAVVNAWILHSSISGVKKMTQKDFRIELATTLCKIGSVETPKRGRPTSSQQNVPHAKKKSLAVPRPPKTVVQDKTDHWPVWDVKRNRCKLQNCKGNTNVKCSKCNLNLCFHATKNCFKLFHE